MLVHCTTLPSPSAVPATNSVRQPLEGSSSRTLPPPLPPPRSSSAINILNEKRVPLAKRPNGLSRLTRHGSSLDDDKGSVTSSSSSSSSASTNAVLKKGILWQLQQRSSILHSTSSSAQSTSSSGMSHLRRQIQHLLVATAASAAARWKERFFILTPDYLHCFKRAPPSHISDMGEFIFKIKLVEVDTVEWVSAASRHSSSAGQVALRIPGESTRLSLKSRTSRDEETLEWYRLLLECVETSKERRRALFLANNLRPNIRTMSSAASVEWLVTRPRTASTLPLTPPPTLSGIPLTLPLSTKRSDFDELDEDIPPPPPPPNVVVAPPWVFRGRGRNKGLGSITSPAGVGSEPRRRKRYSLASDVVALSEEDELPDNGCSRPSAGGWRCTGTSSVPPTPDSPASVSSRASLQLPSVRRRHKHY